MSQQTEQIGPHQCGRLAHHPPGTGRREGGTVFSLELRRHLSCPWASAPRCPGLWTWPDPRGHFPGSPARSPRSHKPGPCVRLSPVGHASAEPGRCTWPCRIHSLIIKQLLKIPVCFNLCGTPRSSLNSPLGSGHRDVLVTPETMNSSLTPSSASSGRSCRDRREAKQPCRQCPSLRDVC